MEDVDAQTNAPPLCAVCSHRHEQGVKCPICGHTGRSRAFECFKNNSGAGVFSVQGFDCFAKNATNPGVAVSLEQANLGLWTFTKILRSRVFPGLPKELPDDPTSRHLVALVGDAPIGMVRWRPAAEESGSQVAVIEHLGVLEPKRRQGLGKKFLQVVVQDIEAVFAQQPTHPQALVAYVPQNDSFVSMKLFQSLGFQPAAQVHVVEDDSFLRMRLPWGCSRRV